MIQYFDDGTGKYIYDFFEKQISHDPTTSVFGRHINMDKKSRIFSNFIGYYVIELENLYNRLIISRGTGILIENTSNSPITQTGYFCKGSSVAKPIPFKDFALDFLPVYKAGNYGTLDDKDYFNKHFWDITT